MNPFANTAHDLRIAARALAKSPAFALTAVLSLAVGIGSATAVFSLVHGILLASLPVPNPQDLRVVEWSGSLERGGMSDGSSRSANPAPGAKAPGEGEAGRSISDFFNYPLFAALRTATAGQAELFGYYRLRQVALRGSGAASTGRGMLVTDNYFAGMGIKPALGRFPDAADHLPGAEPTVVIGYGLWQREYGGRSDAIGQNLRVNGASHTVIGVAPRGFAGEHPGQKTDIYATMASQPLLAEPWQLAASDRWWLKLMARIKPGASEAQFHTVLEAAFAREVADIIREPGVVVSPGRGGPGADREFYSKPLKLLLAIVAAVVLAACANLAGLSLARGTARRQEFSVRAAIGAGRWRLARQSLIENLLLCSFGGGLGIMLAVGSKNALAGLLAAGRDVSGYDLSLNGAVLAFALAATVLATVLSGLTPALRNASADPGRGLKQRGGGGQALRAGRTLIVVQIALSLVLAAGAGVFVRTLVNLTRIDAGFQVDHLLLFQLDPSAAGYENAARVEYFAKALEAAEAIPGARGAALMDFPLLSGNMMGGGFFKLPPQAGSLERRPQAMRLAVSESFFETMGIVMLQGRGFTPMDSEGAPKSLVVNDVFARKYFTATGPLGMKLKIGPADWEIVGVCADVKYSDIRRDIPPTVYLPYRQTNPGGACLAVRSAAGPLSLVPAVRRVVAAIDPNIPVSDITTQERIRDDKLGSERLFATLCTGLAALAMLLSCIGIYGLMAYNVARRTGEIGIRMALGATPSEVSAPIMRETLLLAVGGCAIGLAGYLFAARLIEAQLYGVKPRDPATLAVGVVALVLVAALSAWLPARRASRIDPMHALRAE